VVHFDGDISAVAFRSEASTNLQIPDEVSKRVALEISMTAYNPKSLTAFGDFDFLSFSSLRRQKVDSWMIRKEYPSFSDLAFQEGRLKFLDSLKSGIYHTNFFKSEFEGIAQSNLVEEYEALIHSYESWESWCKS
jgi:hypothetical protein